MAKKIVVHKLWLHFHYFIYFQNMYTLLRQLITAQSSINLHALVDKY